MDLIYTQLSAKLSSVLILQLGRQQITALTVADFSKVEFILCLLSAI
jgi:hypothetical protein